MKSTPLIFLYLLLLSTLFAGTTPTEQVAAVKEAPLSFTLEPKGKAVEFFQPLTIRVIVRNTSQSSISLDPESLRLDAQGWRVVGSHGAWSTDSKGEPLVIEDKSAGRIELAPGASLRLLIVEEYPTFELLGPTQVSYKLTSTDDATKKLLPAEARAVVGRYSTDKVDDVSLERRLAN